MPRLGQIWPNAFWQFSVACVYSSHAWHCENNIFCRFRRIFHETCDLICKARESNLVVAPRDGRGEHGFHLKVTSTNQVRDLIGRGKPSYFTFPFQSEYTALDGPLNQYASLQAWQLRRSSCDRLAAGTSSCSWHCSAAPCRSASCPCSRSTLGPRPGFPTSCHRSYLQVSQTQPENITMQVRRICFRCANISNSYPVKGRHH